MDKKTMLAGAALSALALAAGCAAPHGKTMAGGGASGGKGECYGVNACKAQGECGGPGHACAGNNACKGQGWISLAKADCDAKGGQFKAK
jgi:uncharacterized membrane protein